MAEQQKNTYEAYRYYQAILNTAGTFIKPNTNERGYVMMRDAYLRQSQTARSEKHREEALEASRSLNLLMYLMDNHLENGFDTDRMGYIDWVESSEAIDLFENTYKNLIFDLLERNNPKEALKQIFPYYEPPADEIVEDEQEENSSDAEEENKIDKKKPKKSLDIFGWVKKKDRKPKTNNQAEDSQESPAVVEDSENTASETEGKSKKKNQNKGLDIFGWVKKKNKKPQTEAQADDTLDDANDIDAETSEDKSEKKKFALPNIFKSKKKKVRVSEDVSSEELDDEEEFEPVVIKPTQKQKRHPSMDELSVPTSTGEDLFSIPIFNTDKKPVILGEEELSSRTEDDVLFGGTRKTSIPPQVPQQKKATEQSPKTTVVDSELLEKRPIKPVESKEEKPQPQHSGEWVDPVSKVDKQKFEEYKKAREKHQLREWKTSSDSSVFIEVSEAPEFVSYYNAQLYEFWRDFQGEESAREMLERARGLRSRLVSSYDISAWLELNPKDKQKFIDLGYHKETPVVKDPKNTGSQASKTPSSNTQTDNEATDPVKFLAKLDKQKLEAFDRVAERCLDELGNKQFGEVEIDTKLVPELWKYCLALDVRMDLQSGENKEDIRRSLEDGLTWKKVGVPTAMISAWLELNPQDKQKFIDLGYYKEESTSSNDGRDV